MILVFSAAPAPTATRQRGARAKKNNQVFYQISNLTGSDEDLQFPVLDHITFDDLLLEERFEDGFAATMPLLDPATHRQQSGLDTETCLLISESFRADDNDHGSLVSASLSGVFTSSMFHILTEGSPAPVCVGVAQEFSATLRHPAPDSCTLICAVDRSGERYIVGSFGLAPADSPMRKRRRQRELVAA